MPNNNSCFCITFKYDFGNFTITKKNPKLLNLVSNVNFSLKFLILIFVSGFTFSFPMVQYGINSGILVTWTKSFRCTTGVGEDAVLLLEQAIARRGVGFISKCSFIHDLNTYRAQRYPEGTSSLTGLPEPKIR